MVNPDKGGILPKQRTAVEAEDAAPIDQSQRRLPESGRIASFYSASALQNEALYPLASVTQRIASSHIGKQCFYNCYLPLATLKTR